MHGPLLLLPHLVEIQCILGRKPEPLPLILILADPHSQEVELGSDLKVFLSAAPRHVSLVVAGSLGKWRFSAKRESSRSRAGTNRVSSPTLLILPGPSSFKAGLPSIMTLRPLRPMIGS